MMTTAGSGNRHYKIQICQNKDCCKRYIKSTSTTLTLPDVFRDLLPPSPPPDDASGSNAPNAIELERTGCLSQCGKGPNVVVRSAEQGGDGTEVVYNGITDPLQAVIVLESSPLSLEIPSKLLAAVTVLEKANKVSEFEKKQKLYTSILKALMNDENLQYSAARVHAQVLRAETRCDEGLYAEALEDVYAIVKHPRLCAISKELSGKAYRTVADCYEQLGNIPNAMKAFQQWGQMDPSFQTKAIKEIQRLQDI